MGREGMRDAGWGAAVENKVVKIKVIIGLKDFVERSLLMRF